MADFVETRKAMEHMVQEDSKEISVKEFEQVLQEHEQFLQNGGGGGHWETLYITNLIFGVYQGINTNVEGKQAQLFFKKLTKVDLQNISLSYANCSAVYAPDKSWVYADLEGSLFIDSYLENCSFENADLQAVDFSRSKMQNCNFRNADLRGTDFENCDMTGADLRGATIDNKTSFKNAIMENVLRD